jgi:hypothetical protein
MIKEKVKNQKYSFPKLMRSKKDGKIALMFNVGWSAGIVLTEGKPYHVDNNPGCWEEFDGEITLRNGIEYVKNNS